MPKNMRDFWSGLIYLSVGAFAVTVARDYPFGSSIKMGPGYFPTVLGYMLAMIGVMAIVRSFFRQGEPIEGFAIVKTLWVVIPVLIFGFIVKEAGLVPAVVVVTLGSAMASRYFSWKASILLSIGMAAFSVLVFVKGLALPMPAFGSWFGL